jgi:hypothetical protein
LTRPDKPQQPVQRYNEGVTNLQFVVGVLLLVYCNP